MKRLPRRLRILGQTFKITRPKIENLGNIIEAYQEIQISSRATGIARWDGLRHEWGHAVLSVSGLNQKMTPEMEEAIAQSFGSALGEFCEQMGLKLD